jgi:putative transposase
MELAVSR